MHDDYSRFKSNITNNEISLKNYMSNISLGYIDNNNYIHNDIDEEFLHQYSLMEPYKTFISKIGICWDQVELERDFFNYKRINNETYFIAYYKNNQCINHTFLIFELDDMWCWFENSWKEYEGIHYYKSKERLIKDVKEKFLGNTLEDITSDAICIFKYEKPNYSLGYQEFIKHCENGKKYFQTINM